MSFKFLLAILILIYSTNAQDFTYFGKLNDELELKRPNFPFEQHDCLWSVFNNYTQIHRIFYNEPEQDSKVYQCYPTQKSCLDLKILNVNKENIGEYKRKTESSNGRQDVITWYHVYAYTPTFGITCSSTEQSEKCEYDRETNTLSVKENTTVAINCRTTVYNSSEFTVTIVIEHDYKENTDCLEDESIRNKNKNEAISFNNGEIEVRKECLRKFKKGDTSYACKLRELVMSNDKMNMSDINTVEIKLNIKYWPIINQAEFDSTEFNVTNQRGNAKELSCPFEGNPIEYIWRLIRGNETTDVVSNSKTMDISKLQRGFYTFECLAFMTGDTKSFTKPLRFTANVTKNADDERKEQLIIYWASGAGGLVFLILVILLIIVICRLRKSNKAPNEQSVATTQNEVLNDLSPVNNETNNNNNISSV